ncbi:MAG TPA: LuxR C-terminal-related transcriptional regulator [Anaerolineales bacterium]|nr:LuxR C-terminal-related transcriptional regulator [Anaerolineales bacterium]
MQKSDPLIHTKLRLPFIRPSLVPRPRLQARIAEGLRCPLTLIIAPAGFGKTTLVASCVRGCGMPMTWLSLDKDDNLARRFLNYLVAALQEVNNTVGSEAAQLMATSQHVPAEVVLTSLINDLETAGGEIALVLDDYQFINSQTVHEHMAFLLEHCPNNFHLVIATRSDPPLPLARLRARGQTVELRAADLRFTEPEAAQFLNDVMGLRLDAGSVTALEERTEGWVAGLQMAALSMRDRQNVPAFIEGFSGTNRYILDYLLEEVLASQSPEIQRFLLCTSILERLTAPLCDAVMADDGRSKKEGDDRSTHSEPLFRNESVSILAYLERANLFLVPLDNERIWYRYHHLFADLLRTQLQKSRGEQGVAQLHLLASDWYEQNGSTLEAIHHASLASDFERIERLIEQNYLEMLNRGEMSWIRFWMGKLSNELVYQRPWLCLYEAFSRSWFGQLEEASLLLVEAEKRIRSEVPATETQAMLGYHAYVQSRVIAMQGDTHRAIELCLAARKNLPADNLGLQIEIGITLGYEYFLIGDFTNAGNTLHEMIRSCYTVRAINNPVAAYAILARMHVYQSRLHEAYDLFQKATQLIHESGGQYLSATGLVEVGIADLLCEWNDLEAAFVRVKQGLDFLPWWGKADDLSLAYITLARIQLAQGNLTEALGTVEKAAQLLKTCGVFSEARSAVETAQVKLWLIKGDWPSVDRWVATLEKHFGLHDPFRYEDELIHITQARVFIAQKKLDQAIRLLSSLEESARSGGRQGRLIEIMILKALALQGMGSNVQADLALTKSLTLAEPSGYVRLFLDEGHPMRLLLAQHASRGQLRDYAIHLLSQFDAEPHRIMTAQEEISLGGGLVDPLSRRELEVLHLMALGRTNQEIAQQLIVSRGTIKAHTASIYRKLEVANRTEAVARARQLGILH